MRAWGRGRAVAKWKTRRRSSVSRPRMYLICRAIVSGKRAHLRHARRQGTLATGTTGTTGTILGSLCHRESQLRGSVPAPLAVPPLISVPPSLCFCRLHHTLSLLSPGALGHAPPTAATAASAGGSPPRPPRPCRRGHNRLCCRRGHHRLRGRRHPLICGRLFDTGAARVDVRSVLPPVVCDHSGGGGNGGGEAWVGEVPTAALPVAR